jgi:outer membrane protein TolC
MKPFHYVKCLASPPASISMVHASLIHSRTVQRIVSEAEDDTWPLSKKITLINKYITMKSSHTLSFLFLLALLQGPLNSLAQPTRLTLDEAVSLALEKNRDLKVTSLEVLKSTEKTREARSYALPTVNASAQYLHYFQRQVSFLPGSFIGLGENQLAAIRVGGENSFLGGITLAQPLFQPGVFSGIRAAKISEAISTEGQADVKAAVIADVKKAYLNELIMAAQLTLQQQNITRNEQALKDSRSLLAQGRASRVDTLRAFVALENLRPELIRLHNAVSIANTVLKRTIGLDEAAVVELKDSLSINETIPFLSEENALASAIQLRPEVRRQVLTEKLNKELASGRAAERLPKLSLVGSVQAQQQANDLKLGDYAWPNTSYVGLQLSVPIFSGFRETARVRQANIAHQQSTVSLQNLKEIVHAQVKVGLSNVEEAQQRIGAQHQTVAAAELSYRITRDRWRQGIASRLDLSDAELLLTQAKSNYLAAVHDYLVAQVELERVVGK